MSNIRPRFARFNRTFELLRYHQTRQLLWRLVRIAEGRVRSHLPNSWVFSPTDDHCRLRPGAVEPLRRICQYRLQAWPHRHSLVTEMAEGRFRFLNRGEQLIAQDELASPGGAINWQPDVPRLWRFHLQCHEYLLELAEYDSVNAQQLLYSWLSEPRHQLPHLDPDAWHPFCISRRLPVWLCYVAQYGLDEDLATAFWQSLSNQLQWLRRNQEWDLGGNHYFENLCALQLAESFLQTESGQRIGSVSREIRRQLAEQILPSGEHFERSPTYHALMLMCVAQMAEATEYSGNDLHSDLVDMSERMSNWLSGVLHRDGTVALLGDSAIDETPLPHVMMEWSDDLVSRVTERSARKGDSSEDVYWTIQTPQDAWLLFDTGDVGCDHLPAHAHADLLQLVASVDDRPLLVDTGNYDYEDSPMRRHCRQTAAHNVLQVDEAEQCDVWSRFRMGRRGHVRCRASGENESLRWCAATHDGFAHVGVPETGRIVIEGKATWTVIDWIRSPNEHELTTRLHLHPSWQEHWGHDSADMLSLQGRKTRYRLQAFSPRDGSLSGTWNQSQGWYCPNFGVRIPIPVFSVQTHTSDTPWLGWQLQFKTETPVSEQLQSVQFQKQGVLIQFRDASPLQIGLAPG